MRFIYRIFRRVSIFTSKPLTKKITFLNVLMTDTREASVQQKLLSFYTIIDRCLAAGQRVNIIASLDDRNIARSRVIYTDCLGDYLNNENFNLIFVTPKRWIGRFLALIYVAIYFTKVDGAFAGRLNFACLSALARVRIETFRHIYVTLPCRHWLGLTGGIELPAFISPRDRLSDGTSINALQFGQASLEQKHFSGYKVDSLFVYDELSENIFERLNMQASNVLVAGSPEFEYYMNRLCNEKLHEEKKLSVLFVDQPVQQRGEYGATCLSRIYAMLRALSDDPEVNLKVKLHPRGSAFDGMQRIDFPIVEDWSDGLSRAHVVIGFFSNLCDLALYSGRITFYIGSETILDKMKTSWVINHGGHVSNDVEFVWRELLTLKGEEAKLSDKVISVTRQVSDSPSEIIYKKMVACSEA